MYYKKVYICIKQTGIIVEVTIKKNDSYRELCKVTGIAEDKLANHITKILYANDALGDIEFEASFTVNEVMNDYKDYTVQDLCKMIFPNMQDNIEVVEFLGSLVFWGEGQERPCECCGCEMKETEIDSWSEYECENPGCDNAHGERHIYNEFNNRLI